jgi:hypothetical protein
MVGNSHILNIPLFWRKLKRKKTQCENPMRESSLSLSAGCPDLKMSENKNLRVALDPGRRKRTVRPR